ncbi:D-serine ammonia-lyase [Pseudalkalibacillus caeni]|uniref:Probable D-serine dehydratase n=1 Tax=Exobacillus caeni TaxID=2574798 RepID=A0A5R9F834_9BACL|nr:D-serine ammonia-lyase [Pseudalkalibacillus caeni]TLS37003.1 D-serine ammonia-lyase [Pseudalkalibacillus caeni]
MIAGKPIDKWIEEYPLIKELVETKEVFWINRNSQDQTKDNVAVGIEEIKEAETRLHRFSPFIKASFPETESSNGLIESPLVDIELMKNRLEDTYDCRIKGNLLLKCDNELPIAGSIKARGGIYEVLKHAEKLAIENKKLSITDDYSKMSSKEFKEFFSDYSIAVGSTGNLGLSIGIISAELGFNVTVHMSHDAKEWKKELLREKGVKVVEHASDFSKAVEKGREECLKSDTCYFIDDENSKDLFIGYAVAAFRLKKQLDRMKIHVDENHPLVVYLPCGVGGGPGGVAYGLKKVFGENVHCFFAEPTHSPSMLLGLMTDKHDQISVQDFGIDNRTAADGLAVGRPSRFVGQIVKKLISGVYTVDDDELFKMLALLVDCENIQLEPSALAGMYGPVQLSKTDDVSLVKLNNSLASGTQLVWATGGSLVPEKIMVEDYKKGKTLLHSL